MKLYKRQCLEKSKQAKKLINNLALLKRIGKLQMQRSFTKGKFTAEVSNTKISIDKFVFSPGESQRVTHLLGISGNMAKLKALPPEIKSTPFQVSFGEEGTHTLHKQENPQGVEFSFEDVDSLIEFINMAFDVAQDLIKMNPVKGSEPVYGAGMGDVYEGRG